MYYSHKKRVNIKNLFCKLCPTIESFVTKEPWNGLIYFIEVTSTVMPNEINTLIESLK